MNKKHTVSSILRRFRNIHKHNPRNETFIFLDILIKDALNNNFSVLTTFLTTFKKSLQINLDDVDKERLDEYQSIGDYAKSWPEYLYAFGEYFYSEGLYDRAEKLFQKAIKIDKKFAYAHCSLANILFDRGEFDLAENEYNIAYKLDNSFAFPLYGLGRIYEVKQNFNKTKDYTKAKEYYEKTLEIEVGLILAHLRLGYIYSKENNSLEALEKFKAAESLSIDAGDKYSASHAKYQLNKENQRLETSKKLEELNVDENTDTVLTVLKNTWTFLEGSEVRLEDGILESKIYKRNFLSEPRYLKDINEISIEILQRWNSYTPIIPNGYKNNKGGGYFLKVGGKGIVIDPGFNFIENFRGKNEEPDHYFHEIDAVIISHAHNDHTNDIESILTLLYNYNQAIKGISIADDDIIEGTIRDDLASKQNKDIMEISKDEIKLAFLKSSRRKIIDFYMPMSVFKKYSAQFELFDKRDYRIIPLEAGDVKKVHLAEEQVLNLSPIRAKHNDIISDNCPLGIYFSLPGNNSLIYTGDTGWSDAITDDNNSIEDEYERILKLDDDKWKYSNNKILLAHIGGIKSFEKKYISLPDDQKCESYYPSHLGRIGLVKVNKKVNPDICLISEFGEEFGAARIDIQRIFNDAFNGKIKFFSVDIGFKYDFTESAIRCIVEGQVEGEKGIIKRSFEKIENVRTDINIPTASIFYYHKDIDDVSIIQEALQSEKVFYEDL